MNRNSRIEISTANLLTENEFEDIIILDDKADDEIIEFITHFKENAGDIDDDEDDEDFIIFENLENIFQ